MLNSNLTKTKLNLTWGVGSTATLEAYAIGNIVSIRTTNFFTLKADATSTVTLAYLPEGYRPPAAAYFWIQHLMGGKSYPCLLAIQPGGAITACPYNWSGTADVPSLLYLNFHITFMI